MYMYDINYIKKNYSIIDIAQRLGLKIDKNNKAICPFHNDKNPSLSFNIKENYYHCFACGASGDNIKLVMNILNYDFKNAILFISGNNIIYNQKQFSKKDKEDNVKEYIINKDYNNIYKSFILLLDNSDAIYYLKNRCISKKQVIEHNIKNLPKSRKEQSYIIKQLLQQYKEDDIIKSGIVAKSIKNNTLYLFHYKHRLIIPYFDIDGNTILSIQGRSIDDDILPKYLFNKNSKDSIYNISKLENSKDIVVCEGVIDCLSLERLGYTAIALSGVSKINLLEKSQLLKQYNIYSFADNDKAGKKLIKDIYKLNNYKGTFSINNFSEKIYKDINELLVNSEIKTFTIDTIDYNYFEMPNNKICILDYYIFTKKELQYIKKSHNFYETLSKLTIDKKQLTEVEYNKKYGDLK